MANPKQRLPTKHVRIRMGGVWYELTRRYDKEDEGPGDPVFDWTEYTAQEIGGQFRFPVSAQHILARADLFA